MRIANKRNRGAGRKTGTRITGRNHTAGALIGSSAGTGATRQLLAQSIKRFHKLHPLCEKPGPEPTKPDLNKNTRTNALVVRHVTIFGHGHGLQRAIINESQHRKPERLIMAQH